MSWYHAWRAMQCSTSYWACKQLLFPKVSLSMISCYGLSKVSKHVTYTFDIFVYFFWHYNNFTRFTSVTLNSIIQKNFPEEYAERKSEHDSLINFGVDLMPLFVMDVVIPCQRFPLHIFEPRYRLMVSCHLVLINFWLPYVLFDKIKKAVHGTTLMDYKVLWYKMFFGSSKRRDFHCSHRSYSIRIQHLNVSFLVCYPLDIGTPFFFLFSFNNSSWQNMMK